MSAPALVAGIALLGALGPPPSLGPAAAAPDTVPLTGRAAVDALEFPPLVFEPPRAMEVAVLGVPVFHLHDPALPLVDVFIQVRGGVSHLPRRELGPMSGLPTFLRNGGTRSLPPDSVDRRLDLLAVQLSLGGGGGGTVASINTLTRHLDEAVGLVGELLTEPGFDREAIEVWRGQELERARRRIDDPGTLAFTEFNRLLFGDHPVGWITEESDLDEAHFTDRRLRELHARLYCREHLTLGVVGDVTWDEAAPRIERLLERFPPCPAVLPDPPVPEMRDDGGVYILPREIEQTTIVMAHPGGVRQEDSPDYFASRIANHILGAGGFSSRLMARVRTERGLAYGASSLWTTPSRYEGLVGAVTAAQPERTVETVRVVLATLDEFRSEPPTELEVERALDEIVNGYVFAFDSPAQIVGRSMSYRIQELPDDWLERFLEGVQGVTAGSVFEVTRRYLDPDRMTILLVGDPDRFDPGLAELGPLYRLSVDGTIEPW